MKLAKWERCMKRERRGKLPELVARAAWCHKQLETMTSLTSLFLKDEHFVTLLRAEGLFMLPAYLGKHLAATSAR
jgi:hypothetical protein